MYRNVKFIFPKKIKNKCTKIFMVLNLTYLSIVIKNVIVLKIIEKF